MRSGARSGHQNPATGNGRSHLVRASRSGQTVLDIREIVRTSWVVLRSEWRSLAWIAFLTLAPLAVVDAIMSEVIERYLPGNHPWFLDLVVLGVSSGVAITLGTVFLGGVVDHIVGATVLGHERPTLRSLVDRLPWVRLVVADVIITALVSVTAAAGLLGGFVVLTLFAVVGPLINIEHLSVSRAFVRSVQLVRRSAGWVLLLSAAPLVGEHILVESFEQGVRHEGPGGTAVAQILVTVVVLTYLALLAVCLCHALLEVEARDAPPGGDIDRPRPGRPERSTVRYGRRVAVTQRRGIPIPAGTQNLAVARARPASRGEAPGR